MIHHIAMNILINIAAFIIKTKQHVAYSSNKACISIIIAYIMACSSYSSNIVSFIDVSS